VPRVLIVFVFLTGLLASCISVPELDAAISDDARFNAYPKLIQLDGMLAVATEGKEASLAASKNLVARAKNLKRRAKRLRKPVVDRRTRRRMAAALRRHPV
jgi:hypothetical protein